MRTLRIVALGLLAALGCADDDGGVGDQATTSTASSIEVTFTDDPHHFTEAERAAIREIAEATFVEVRTLLPDLSPDLLLEVGAGTLVIPETGEVGASTAPGHVAWIVDPAYPGGVDAVARAWLRTTLFHELHHQVRGYVLRGGGAPDSFMDSVVAEGLATAFQRQAAPVEIPWGTYPDDVRAWVDELLALPVTAPYQQWMFEHPDGRRWIGYRAGAFLADQAIAASGRSAADLVRTPTTELLVLAGVS